MFSYEVKIPKDRVAVLIGEEGKTKRAIESATKTRITIDSKEGDVIVQGEDGVLLFTAQNIVKAIARGFNPDIALRLLKSDWAYEVIDLSAYSTKKDQQQRMKGRVIGTRGKSRGIIENLTDSNISVYGKTIGIIAPIETIGDAKHAIEELLGGAQHAGVYRMLERKQRDMKLRNLMGTQRRNT